MSPSRPGRPRAVPGPVLLTAVVLALLALTACGRHSTADGPAAPAGVTTAPVTAAAVTTATTSVPSTTPAAALPAGSSTAPILDLSGIQSALAGAGAANSQAGADLSAGDAASGTADAP